FQEDEFKMAYANLVAAFGAAEPYVSFVPTYPGVFWSYMSATDGTNLSSATGAEIAARLSSRGITTKQYAPDVHRAAFALPPFVKDLSESAVAAAVPRG